MNRCDEQAPDRAHVIPGPFYWALNEVAENWREFRYRDPNGKIKRLSAAESGVYHQLCRWANNETRACHRFIRDLSKELNLTPNTLRGYLRNLEGAKLIAIQHGRFHGDTGVCAPTVFTLLDVEEAVQYGCRLEDGEVPEQSPETGERANAEQMGVNVEGMCSASEQMDANSAGMCSDAEQIDANSEHMGANSATNKRLSKDSGKTEKTVCSGRDDTTSSSPSMELPAALTEAEARRRFPLAAALAEWCRQTLGRSPFPAAMPAAELEPFEDGLARLDRATQPCGQSAVEALTTRLALRPEVREQLRAARRPAPILARQLNYAVEDFTTRAARLPDTPLRASPAPPAAPAAPGPPGDDEKPKWMSEKQWAFYKEQRLLRKQAREQERLAREQDAPGLSRSCVTGAG